MLGLLGLLLVGVMVSCSDDEKNDGETTRQVAVMWDGKEVSNGFVVPFAAEKNLFYEMEAHTKNLVVKYVGKEAKGCLLEVEVVPEKHDAKYLKWCGINGKCETLNTDKPFAKKVEGFKTTVDMNMDAFFGAETEGFATAKVKVKANGKEEVNFMIVFKNNGEG